MFHIGSARTALFNWLYARHTGGTFILRIEDTDAARNKPVDRLLSEGKAYESDGAIKFRTPKTPITVPDLICGNIQFDRTNEPDLVIQRKDGSPVFHLVNVVDDIEMEVTHVIRGEDHLSNTQKHLALIEAFGAKAPHYAHIPLILNPNGSKMSKRDAGSSIAEYEEQGYLPEAVRNYLCLLGWSTKDNREVLAIEEAVEKFDLPQVGRANARFDKDKLFWINGEYMRAATLEALEPLALSILKKHGIVTDNIDPAYFRAALAIVKEKIKLGRELPEWMSYFFTEEFSYDEAAAKKVFTPEGIANIAKLRERLGSVDASKFMAADLESEFKSLAATSGQKVGALIHPSRLAVSGRPVGPSLYHLLEVLGKDRVLARIERAERQFGGAT